VLNLEDRTCSCWEWQVSGLPCKHALAFIIALADGKIEMHVDSYYSIEKFRAAYAQLILAMTDKTQWPKSSHGFFIHPPLLTPIASKTKTERHKGGTEKKKKKGPAPVSYLPGIWTSLAQLQERQPGWHWSYEGYKVRNVFIFCCIK
jgi:hypothetical protein